MKSYSNFSEFQINPSSFLSISTIRFQVSLFLANSSKFTIKKLKYAYKYEEQVFLMLNSKKNSQNTMKNLILTNKSLYIITQGRIYKFIALCDIQKIKWCYSDKIVIISSKNNKDLELLTTLRNGYRLVNVLKEILL